MKKALHFGAGNIGRGFIGKILYDGGYQTIFADVNEELITALQKEKTYYVEIVGESRQRVRVDGVSGILSHHEEALIEQGLTVNLITTAVGPNILPYIAPAIAKIIGHRAKNNQEEFLTVIACENMIRATDALRDEIFSHLTDIEINYAKEWVAFANSAVDRIVPPMERTANQSTLDVMVEEFFEWVVDKTQLKEDLGISDIVYTDNLEAFIERKLFTLNTSHAVTAYAGALLGLETIAQSINDGRIRAFVQQVMAETGEILIRRHQFDRASHEAYQQKIMKRFANVYLKDSCQRVGRDVARKMGANDRFFKPIGYAKALAISYSSLLIGVSFALSFSEEERPSVWASVKEPSDGLEQWFMTIHGDEKILSKDDYIQLRTLLDHPEASLKGCVTPCIK